MEYHGFQTSEIHLEMENKTEENKLFANEIIAGLRSKPKSLPSKYFYDAEGDRLFQKIMHLDEYYLTRSEESILQEKKAEILRAFLGDDESFRLVELGAGDGKKTKVLLKHFADQNVNFVYNPIDISPNVLQILKSSVEKDVPNVQVEPIEGDYFRALEALKKNHLHKEVVMFLGSTIGNFDPEDGKSFLKKLGENMTSGDLLFIGFDLMKDPAVILDAYNDAEGITAEFNHNLLNRINSELDANFDRSVFKHYPTYDPLTGITKSFLISTEAQEVHFKAIGETVQFEAWEPIHMEVSLKFSPSAIKGMAEECGFKELTSFRDKNNYFQDSLWEKI